MIKVKGKVIENIEGIMEGGKVKQTSESKTNVNKIYNKKKGFDIEMINNIYKIYV